MRHLEGRYGREATAVRTPRGGAARIEGRYGRTVGAVRGPRGGAAWARGPRGGAVAWGRGRYWGGRYRTLPVARPPYYHGGHGYYWYGGHYYRRFWDHGDVWYVGIVAPIGLIVDALADDHDTVVVEGTSYYYYNNVYYIAGEEEGTYVVTEAPDVELETVAAEVPGAPDPFEVLKGMSDFLGAAEKFEVTATDAFDGETESGQKVQMTTVRQLRVSRPNRVHVDATGGDLDREVWYDGEQLAMFDANQQAYGVVDVPDDIDGMLDFAAREFGVTVPVADLFYSDVYEALLPGTRTGQYLGLHKVGGTDCHHLAFEGSAANWQIWIEAGERPLPRKLVISDKQQPDHPRYTATLEGWNLSPTFAAGEFVFRPPADAEKIEVTPSR